MNIIQASNLQKHYNGRCVLDIRQISIRSGETVSLIGNNGAGKTTLLRLILDLVRPDQGTVYLKDIPVSMQTVWKYFTTSYLDESFLINYLTAEEYFYFIGKAYKISKHDVYKALKLFDGFFAGEILNQRKYIRDFSKGNAQKIGIASCFIQHPELVLLDEPFANLDPTSRENLKRIIRYFNDTQGTTMLISSHDLSNVAETTERIILMEKGKIISDAPKSEQAIRQIESYFTSPAQPIELKFR
jgi:ABC-2 type transport system ATP-binding protein